MALGQLAAMRMHIPIDDDLVAELDRRVGLRGRSRSTGRAVRRLCGRPAAGSGGR